MKYKTGLALLCLLASGCMSHQYTAMTMDKTEGGVNYKLTSGTLTVQYQEYQFWPNASELLNKCRFVARDTARKLNVEVVGFNFSTERNKLTSTTSCIAFAELK